MKLHKPVLNAILTALQKIFFENAHSDKVLEQIFKQEKKLGKKDRSIIAESTYHIIRYWYYYQYLANNDNDIEKLVWTYFKKNNFSFDNIPLNHISLKSENNISDKIKLSYNDDLWNEGLTQLGKERWLQEATALNTPAALVIRTNTLKVSREQLSQYLLSIGIETIAVKDVPEALIIKNKKFLTQNEFFKKGFYEFQDLSSQKVAHFIPQEILMHAHRVIDACAGAGGKTLHLSAMMQNKGQIIAMDVNEKKLNELQKRTARAGCSNVIVKHIHSSKVFKRLKCSADIVLIDAPCSGTGVIKRNPDTKLKFSSKELQKLIHTQQQILHDYASMVKTNGYLLYVTCSILPKENEAQIHYFLKHHPEFQFIKEQNIYPSEGFDGFYMCLLKKHQDT